MSISKLPFSHYKSGADLCGVKFLKAKRTLGPRKCLIYTRKYLFFKSFLAILDNFAGFGKNFVD